jgi:hypothetical protein
MESGVAFVGSERETGVDAPDSRQACCSSSAVVRLEPPHGLVGTDGKPVLHDCRHVRQSLIAEGLATAERRNAPRRSCHRMKVIRDRPKSVDLEEFLSRPLFGFFATASESGPRVSPVWFLWEDEAIWIIGNKRTDTFPSRVDSEPRCAIAFVDFDAASGLVHHVGMRGRATVETWNRGRASRILRRYLGSNETHWDRERFLEPLDDAENVLVRFTPETAVARDQSYRAPSPRARR